MELAARGKHAVQKDTLVRVGGAAAILAGLLRAAAAVVPGTGSEVERQSVYFIVDLLLLLGVLAAYAQHHKSLGRSGAGAFLITVTGLLLVRSSRAVPGLDLYPAGAASVAIGWVVLGLTWWKWSHGSPLVPLLLLLSLLLGVVSQLGGRAATFFAASGLLFGAAMVEVGRQLLLAFKKDPRSDSCRGRYALCALASKVERELLERMP